ncbi:MAG: hypothetical protein J0H68_09600 [Sphingobacteriia bacterium]|nr:hypothetical protein [Sphingobacteriia bacterium]
MYIALKIINFDYYFEAITSPLGFAIEANIKSRGWILCGQSDLDYFEPKFNMGIKSEWEIIKSIDLKKILRTELKLKPVIIDTEPLFIDYYHHIGVGIGMPHTITILDYNETQNSVLIYDKLSPNTMDKNKEGFFWISLEVFNKAFENRLYFLKYQLSSTDLNWEKEFFELIKQSYINMRKTVSREFINMQALGIEGIKTFSETIRYFDPNYYDDSLTIWLFTNRIPIYIAQSVLGNRYIFTKAFEKTFHNRQFNFIDETILALKEVMQKWVNLRKTFIKTGNGELNFENLADELLEIAYTEEKLSFTLENFYMSNCK